ncbi:hypothetical protein A9Q99_07970 [Gammaproteobacteria bacterium 45_16_T64]|nr:hypothetical protein A9Q99_07970 [Gammaproteobacteria bacterium 45_16_T64]
MMNYHKYKKVFVDFCKMLTVIFTIFYGVSVYASDPFVYDNDPTALLGSSRGGLAIWDYCYGKDDEAVLPVDPRSMVQPGISDGKAVHFNAYWKDCHVDEEAVREIGTPETCGELRDIFHRGEELMDTGGVNVSSLFAGSRYNSAEAVGGIAVFSAKQFNKLWDRWGGYSERPDNFDELVTNRYGSGLSEGRNPYPLPGEDPNETDGGSGQLPEMLTQLRKPDGSWSSKIGVTCHGCHSGSVGTPEDGEGLGFLFGGSSATDLNLFLRDMLPLGYIAGAVTPLNLTQVRGTNNASSINIAFIFPEEGLPSIVDIIGILLSGSTGSMDSPAFWNMGHRPVKFVDGVFPMDAPRVDAVFYSPFLGLFGSFTGGLGDKAQDWMREHGPLMNRWVESLKAPEYPYPVDIELAEEGAVMFHELDLWAPERRNRVDTPEGNGSCASCHGAYSPRYVNNEEFLASPKLEGMASYIVPLGIIDTDRRRALTNNEAMLKAGSNNFFGYPATKGTENDCGPQNQKRLRGDRELGYLAQPLYGVWATAPYFHNGSVPNVWEVLKPADRKPIWERKSAPKPEQTEGVAIMGFDTDLERAFDSERLGWDYEEVACTSRSPMLQPGFSCSRWNKYRRPFPMQLVDILFGNVVAAWNLLFPPTITDQQMENRKIYNTHLYSQGNMGHEFTSVLTDDERYAIIEYLKTL